MNQSYIHVNVDTLQKHYIRQKKKFQKAMAETRVQQAGYIEWILQEALTLRVVQGQAGHLGDPESETSLNFGP